METKTKTTKTATNKGSAKKTETKKQASGKVEKSNTKFNEFVNPTAEDRIRKIKNFQILADKHAFLKDKENELENFVMSSDGTKEKISLSNAKGFTFEVSNTQVIKEVIKVVTEKLTAFKEDAERQVLEYEI